MDGGKDTREQWTWETMSKKTERLNTLRRLVTSSSTKGTAEPSFSVEMVRWQSSLAEAISDLCKGVSYRQRRCSKCRHIIPGYGSGPLQQCDHWSEVAGIPIFTNEDADCRFYCEGQNEHFDHMPTQTVSDVKAGRKNFTGSR